MGAALAIAFKGCPYDKMIEVWDKNYIDEYKFHFPPKDGELRDLHKQHNMDLMRISQAKDKSDETFNRDIKYIKYMLKECYVKKGMKDKIIAADLNSDGGITVDLYINDFLI